MSANAAPSQFQFVTRCSNQSLENLHAEELISCLVTHNLETAMHRLLITALGLAVLSTNVVADEAKPAIDLSPQADHRVIQHEHQSIRPGAMEKILQQGQDQPDAWFSLSYDEEEIEKDEYGLDRKIEGPTTTDYSKPIDQGSRD